MKIWKQSCQRNPKQARFGNKNAKKRRGHEARTELPSSNEQADEADEGVDVELDEQADKAEEENVFAATEEDKAESELSLIAPYKVPPGFTLSPPPNKVVDHHCCPNQDPNSKLMLHCIGR